VQPAITAFASRPGVTAVVGMSASSFVRVPAAPGAPAYVTGCAFNLTLKIVHPPLTPVSLRAAQIAGGVPNPGGDALGRSAPELGQEPAG
jgi:hypothetical protein